MTNRLVERTDDERVNTLLAGAKWGSEAPGTATEISYSFPSGEAYWNYTREVSAGWYGLSSAQKQVFIQALQSWSDVATITFTEVADTETYGDMRVAYSYAVEDDSSAYAYLPGGGLVDSEGVITPDDENGDIWLHPSTTDFSTSGDGMHTLRHEIGHALGLKHSFEAEGDFPTLDSEKDHTGYTVMSYTESDAAGYTFTVVGASSYYAQAVQPLTPMLYDILAIQHLYGANTETRADDTVYTFSNRAELKTIWDGGGIDTFDLSGQEAGVRLDLAAGSFSDIGQRQMTFETPLIAASNNIAIAFDTEIENAIGTAYDDVLLGNALDNTLTGGAGDDHLNGGEGEDSVVFSGNSADYQFRKVENNLVVSNENGTDGTDTLTSFEQFVFADQTVALADLQVIGGDPVASVPTRKSEVNFTPDEADTAYFLLEINAPTTHAVSVEYSTRDGSAKAGEDYVKTSGVATLQPGQTFFAIAVELIDDKESEGNEFFELVVSKPVSSSLANDAVELSAQRIILDNDFLL